MSSIKYEIFILAIIQLIVIFYIYLVKFINVIYFSSFFVKIKDLDEVRRRYRKGRYGLHFTAEFSNNENGSNL